MTQKRPPGSIKTRIAAGFMALLAVAFLLLALSFNLVVNKYIQTQADQQLSIAKDNVSHNVLGRRLPLPLEIVDFESVMSRINNIARRATFLTQVKVLVMDEAGMLVHPSPKARAKWEKDQAANAESGEGEIQEESEVGEKIALYEAMQRKKGIDISKRNMQRFADGHRTYFLCAVPIQIGGTEERLLHMVLYMDMTDVTHLARTLNLVLLVIIGIAVLIAACVTLLMSNRITRPIRALSNFAEAIGRSDFTPRRIECRDRELIELGEVMNRSAIQLDKYDKEQKTFFQNVSHELRTPLMSIKGYAEGISVGVFDDEKGAAGVIIQESDTLTKMVEELLYLSKIDNVTDQNEKAALDVRELLSSCAEGLRGVALHENTAIAYDFPDEPVLVFGAEKPLERAFSNLMSNGLRYASSKVMLRCCVEDGEAVVRIEDDGDGISAEDMPHLFDRFYKGRNGKHGIGLSIVKAVVAQHNGRVTAENADPGAIFTVWLPNVK